MYPNEETHGARTVVYGFLGAVMAAPPGEELLDKVKTICGQAAGIDPMQKVWSEMERACFRVTPQEIHEEYRQLFLGVGNSQIMPYASWYLTGNLMDKPLVRIRSDLERLGIRRKETVKESEDHVSALCETMVLLCGMSGPEWIENQADFFDRHMKPWMNRFFMDLRNAPSANFFKAVGQMGLAFFRFEEEFFGSAKEVVKTGG